MGARRGQAHAGPIFRGCAPRGSALHDANGAKGGAQDKRCTLEAHVVHSATVAVSHDAPSLAEALRGATSWAARALDSQIGKRRDVRDHPSIRKDIEAMPENTET